MGSRGQLGRARGLQARGLRTASAWPWRVAPARGGGQQVHAAPLRCSSAGNGLSIPHLVRRLVALLILIPLAGTLLVMSLKMLMEAPEQAEGVKTQVQETLDLTADAYVTAQLQILVLAPDATPDDVKGAYLKRWHAFPRDTARDWVFFKDFQGQWAAAYAPGGK